MPNAVDILCHLILMTTQVLVPFYRKGNDTYTGYLPWVTIQFLRSPNLVLPLLPDSLIPILLHFSSEDPGSQAWISTVSERRFQSRGRCFCKAVGMRLTCRCEDVRHPSLPVLHALTNWVCEQRWPLWRAGWAWAGPGEPRGRPHQHAV